jgi:hypothetical protein
MSYELMINYRMKVHIDSIRNINPLTFPSRESGIKSTIEEYNTDSTGNNPR